MNGHTRRVIGMALFLVMQLCVARVIKAQDQKTPEVDPNVAFEGRTVNKVEIAVQPSEDIDKFAE